jgi:hypothetical protein
MQRTAVLVGVLCVGLVSGAAYWTYRAKAMPPVSGGTESAASPTAVSPASNAAPPPTAGDAPRPTVPRPTIITRKQWKAKELRGEGTPHTIHCITIHHTGVAQKVGTTIEKKLQGLQTYSQSESRLASGKLKPAWLDVPYHFYISVDGKIAEGRPIRFVSDTNTEYDPTRHATIVVEGNFETEQPTDEQLEALQALTAWLSVEYQVPASRIKAHNDYARTACPGVNLKKSLPALVEKVAELAGVPEPR